MSHSFYWDDLFWETKEYMLGSMPVEDNYDFQRITSLIASGYKQFVYPPVLQGSGAPGQHVWSFLKPVITDTLKQGERDQDAPDDIASISNGMTLTEEDYRQVNHCSVNHVRKLYAASDESGTPQFFALRTTNDGGMEFWVWPEPDKDYEVQYQYERAPSFTLEPYQRGDGTLSTSGDITLEVENGNEVETDDRCKITQNDRVFLLAVTDVDNDTVTLEGQSEDELESGTVPYRMFEGQPHLRGYQQFRETILASVLAVAEERVEETPGVKHQKFYEIMLPAAINRDRRASAPRHLDTAFNQPAPDRGGDTSWDLYHNGVEVE